ncbi:MAG: hypothetical protein K0R38_3889 [Polyangiaceae bacterium]|nr:hypothetical protein [Polyangiaceae bacterium]
MPPPECMTELDCPAPPPGQCGSASCTEGKCSLQLGPVCNDGDPCTVDSCGVSGCVFQDGRVDADADGAFATGNVGDPKAALGCGTDCDDSSAQIFPGAREQCDALDNDCNGVTDDASELVPSGLGATRVSLPEALRSSAAGLAFDGEAFGATMTSTVGGRTQGQFQRIGARGQLIGGAQRIARVNAESYGGPLVWSGERFLTAYEDARQDGNYEIYFDHLNRQGERLIEDLRVTNADEYSLRPSVLWTGAEALLVWDDRRFEGSEDASAVFGQRVSAAGTLLGGNVRLSPSGVRAEAAAVGLGTTRVGIALLALGDDGLPSLVFMTTSRTLDEPSPPITIPFADAEGPVVTPLGDNFVITFHQHTGAVIGPSIYGILMSQSGAPLGNVQSLTAGAPHARGNATFAYGDRFVMVWADNRDGTYQLYSQVFDRKLAPISPRQRLTTTMSDTRSPVVAPAADGGVGVLYTDEAAGQSQTMFTRLDCALPQRL